MAARFWINSEGEFSRDDDVIGGVLEIGPGSAPIEQQQAAQLAQLGADELALLKRWEELVPAESSRWRLYAQLTAEGPVLLLSTEFVWWADDEHWWARLRALAAEHGAQIEDMWTREERGYWQDAPKTLDIRAPRAREHPSYVPAENEGRVQAQVALNFDIVALSPPARDALIERFSAASAEQWATAGVNVL